MKPIAKLKNPNLSRLLRSAWFISTALIACKVQGQQPSPVDITPKIMMPFASHPASAGPEQADTPNSGPAHGIKVHGHWILQVKNADGTLGERREFENSLVTDQALTSGDQYMLALLSGNITPSDPGIALVTFSDPSLATTYKPSTYCPMTGVGGPAGIGCYVLTTPASLLNAYAKAGVFSSTTTNLTISTQLTAPVAWSLSGNFTVPSGVTAISVVQSLASFCATKSVVNNSGPPANDLNETLTTRAADLAPSGCSNTAANIGSDFAWIAALTSTAVTNASGVATPLVVTAGQVVTVIVKISFS